jgi:hypothetical protein
MNRAICVSTAFLLGSAVMAAQTTTTPKKDSPVQATVIQVAPPVSSCPVSLQAQQTPGGDRVLVDGLPPTGIAQKLHLIVNASDSKRIVAANVTVHGYTNKSRAMPAMANQDTGDGAKTLNVSFPTGPKREIAADLAVPGLTAVTAIDLNSVTFADGSTWKLATGRVCRSWIDSVMPVSGH